LNDISPSLYRAKLITIGFAILITAIVLIGWNSPQFAETLPKNWFKMQATTALTTMLVSFCLLLKAAKLRSNTLLIQRLLLAFAFIVICTTFFIHLHDKVAILGPYLVSSSHLLNVHPSSIQSALSLLLIIVTKA